MWEFVFIWDWVSVELIQVKQQLQLSCTCEPAEAQMQGTVCNKDFRLETQEKAFMQEASCCEVRSFK